MDAKPIQNLPGTYSKPVNAPMLPTVYLSSAFGVVLFVNEQHGGIRKLTLEEAERKGFVEVVRQMDNHFGAVSAIAIRIKHSRINIVVVPKV